MPVPQSIDDLRALERLIEGMPAADRAALERQVASALKELWVPLPGPQAAALASEADELFYGGQGGGGKTEVLLGAALTKHKYSLILRRVNKEVRGLERRMTEILGSRTGYNSQTGEWKVGGRVVQLGGCQFEDDKFGYQGVPHDLKAFDELPSFTESQYRFIIGWNRSADPKQRCRVIGAGNPPMNADGLWVINYWGPWLDPKHPNPAKPGELRWFTTLNGVDTEVAGPEPVFDGKRMVTPRSRTFLPATLEDNPFLEDAGYGSVLASLPDAMRRAMRDGDFTAGIHDDEWQLIPTEWVRAAQARWTPDGGRDLQMTAMGIDVAQGGDDKSVLAPRYGVWYAPLQRKPGKDTPTSSDMVAFILAHARHGAGLVIDIGGGYGIGPAAHIKENGGNVVQFDGSKPSAARAAGSALQFYNKRAEAWWRFREALDPDQEGGSPICLPAEASILGDLTAPRYELTPRGLKVEAKVEVKKRLGRSPDDGDSIVMAWSEGQALAVRKHSRLNMAGRRPAVQVGYAKAKGR